MEMDLIYKNAFSTLEHNGNIKLLRFTWFPGSRCMSDIEFLQQIHGLSIHSLKHNAKILFMDCFDFEYPIHTRQLASIKKDLCNSGLILFGLIISKNIIGKHSMNKLLDYLVTPETSISIFKNRADAGLWFSESFMETMCSIYNF